MAIQSTTSSQRLSSGVVLSETNVPRSTGVKTALGKEEPVTVRLLTGGEIAMARQVFQDAINFRIVRIHAETYLPFQNKNTATTPNGEIYFSPTRFRSDFSQETNGDKHWFIHEMTHVWQYQLGYPVKWRGALRIGLSYEYDLAEDKLLKDYNMEAQGDIVADYCVLKFLNAPGAMQEAQWRYRNDLSLYEKVLRDFLSDPKSQDNLPGGVAKSRSAE